MIDFSEQSIAYQRFINSIEPNQLSLNKGKDRLDGMLDAYNKRMKMGLGISKYSGDCNQANTFANVSNKNSIKNMDIMKTFQGAQNSTNVLQINNFSGVGVMSDPIIVRDSLKKLNLNKLGHNSQMLTSRSKKDAQVGGQTVSVENLIDPTSGIQNQLGRELKKSGSKYLKKKQGGKLGDMDQKIYSSLSSQLFSKIRNK